MKHTRTKKNFIEQPVIVTDAKTVYGSEVVNTLVSSMTTPVGNTQDKNVIVETYQETTGALCASGYDKLGTQEAMNDMYVVQSNWDGSQVSPTLTANNANGAQRMPDKDNFNAVITFTPDSQVKNTEDDIAFSMLSRDYKDPQCVVYGLDRASFNQGINAKFDFQIEEENAQTLVSRGPGAVCETYQDVTGTLDCNIAKGTGNQIANNDMLIANSVVRRLTPKECERLQGFPDDWTMIDDWTDTQGKKHKCTDSARYKALGNSICLPYWDWCAERMVEELMMDTNEEPTMASLFDGIGGFPFVYQKHGCRPVWASEIEEFPIAVTKVRFPE